MLINLSSKNNLLKIKGPGATRGLCVGELGIVACGA